MTTNYKYVHEFAAKGKFKSSDIWDEFDNRDEFTSQKYYRDKTKHRKVEIVPKLVVCAQLHVLCGM